MLSALPSCDADSKQQGLTRSLFAMLTCILWKVRTESWSTCSSCCRRTGLTCCVVNLQMDTNTDTQTHTSNSNISTLAMNQASSWRWEIPDKGKKNLATMPQQHFVLSRGTSQVTRILKSIEFNSTADSPLPNRPILMTALYMGLMVF